MIDRIHHQRIEALLRQFPAVVLLGARQIGKTTLARETASLLKKQSVYYDLERPSDRSKLHDIESALKSHANQCVIIDEAQTLPELFTVLRPLIDEHRKPGRFLLLGSVSPHLIKGISETLAGRVAHVELPPITLPEALSRNLNQNKAWFRGGYPEPLLVKKDDAWWQWMENYHQSFIQRDVNFLMGESISPQWVGKLWQMLASVHGGILNTEMLSRSIGMSRPTVLKYLDFLEGSFLIRRLHPWFLNMKKRIVKAPKLYFRDSGILHYMHSITSHDHLKNHIISGNSWEGYVIEQIQQLKPLHINLFYYRTHHGAEADLVLARGNRPVSSIEIKLSNSPEITKGWHEVKKDLNTLKNFILTPASDDYQYDKTSRVCSLATFLNKYLPKIG